MSRSIVSTVAAFGSGNILVKLGNAVADGIQLGNAMWSGSDKAVGKLGGIAGEAFDFALGECATEGQVSLIMEIGPGGFQEALDMAIENGRDASGLLTDMTNHPEAIGEILEGAEDIITDALSEGRAD